MPTMELSFEMTPEQKNAVIAALLQDKSMKEYVVSVECEHASYVEDGSGPGGKVPLKTIKDWLVTKRGGGPVKDLDALAVAIQRKIYARGTSPRPFLRPAEDAVVNSRLNKCNSTRETAEAIAAEAQNMLILNDSVFTQELLHSIHVREAPKDFARWGR